MRVVVAIGLSLLASAASALDFTVPPEHVEELKKQAMRLVIAQECAQRLDMPGLYADAKIALRNFFKRAGRTDADALVDAISAKMAEMPVEKDTGKFSLFNPKVCGSMWESIKKEIDTQ